MVGCAPREKDQGGRIVRSTQRRSTQARSGRRRIVRFLAIFSFDAAASAAALVAAGWLRFDGAIPEHLARALPIVVPLAVGSRLVANVAARLHRWSFRLAGLPEAVRVVAAAVAGTTIFVGLAGSLVPGVLPRSVFVIDLLLATAALGFGRFAPRAALRWQTGRFRRRAGAARTIIVGGGEAAELLARDLQRTRGSAYDLVGFVEEDRSLRGGRLDGKPILGRVRDLPELVRRHGASVVLLAETHHDPARIREILDLCDRCRVRFKIIPAALAARDDRLSVAMLNDVSTEDLLHRPPIDFDDAEICGLVRGRRALVTGAGGSIGGELCRQLAHHGAAQIVMVDMNENELYLQARRLAEEHRALDVRVEVADVREALPLRRLGARYRPQVVFHAAAHKHVPLMEVDAGRGGEEQRLRHPERRRRARTGRRRALRADLDRQGGEPDQRHGRDQARGRAGRRRRLAQRSPARLRRGALRQRPRLARGASCRCSGEQIAAGGPVTVTHPEMHAVTS